MGPGRAVIFQSCFGVSEREREKGKERIQIITTMSLSLITSSKLLNNLYGPNMLPLKEIILKFHHMIPYHYFTYGVIISILRAV